MGIGGSGRPPTATASATASAYCFDWVHWKHISSTHYHYKITKSKINPKWLSLGSRVWVLRVRGDEILRNQKWQQHLIHDLGRGDSDSEYEYHLPLWNVISVKRKGSVECWTHQRISDLLLLFEFESSLEPNIIVSTSTSIWLDFVPFLRVELKASQLFPWPSFSFSMSMSTIGWRWTQSTYSPTPTPTQIDQLESKSKSNSNYAPTLRRLFIVNVISVISATLIQIWFDYQYYWPPQWQSFRRRPL